MDLQIELLAYIEAEFLFETYLSALRVYASTAPSTEFWIAQRFGALD
ncbi:hypothetical protein [Nocardia vulneris]|nr:hypothetical protein [Nocardia vulneris]